MKEPYEVTLQGREYVRPTQAFYTGKAKASPEDDGTERSTGPTSEALDAFYEWRASTGARVIRRTGPLTYLVVDT